MHISIKAESLFDFLGIPVTNSIFATFVLLFLLFLLTAIFKTIKLKNIPSGLQNLLEMVVESLDNLATSTAGEKSRVFLPIIATFFLFILFSNWMGLLPGFGTIGFYEKQQTVQVENVIEELSIENRQKKEEVKMIPLLRGPTADLNTTIALGILSFISIQYFGFKYHSFSYFKKFINFKGPIDFFVGILEIFSDLSKIVSFSFRLFGNIFAGEVLLTVIAFLSSGFATLPFLGLEIFVGFIQALVFTMLTLVFINIATQSHG